MDRRERLNDPQTALLAALTGWQAGLWAALPAVIDSFDPDAMTVTATPAIQGRIRKQDGSFEFVTITQLLDVPVVFPQGGPFVLTFPIQAGDEALIVFSSRCIDAWWQSGGVQPPADLRMHDLSDGFALVGPRSQVRKVPNISTSTAQLRNQDGDTYVELTPDTINIIAPSAVNVQTQTATIQASDHIMFDSPQTTCTGKLTVQGAFEYQDGLTGDGQFKNNDVDVGSTHRHTDGTGIDGNTGDPLP